MKKIRKMKKVNKSTKFNEIFEDKDAAKILEDRGMHCFGCPFASIESLEEGAKAHGLDADELIDELNQKKKISKKKKIKTKGKKKK